MAGEIAYKLTADEAQALQAVSRLSREFGLNETAIKKSIEATKELERTQQQMSREGQRMFDETRTSTEKYNAEVARTKELLARNAIDAETYRRKIDQLSESHKGAFGGEALGNLKSFAMSFVPAITAAGTLKQILEELSRLKSEAAARDRSAEMSEGSLAEVAGGDPQRFQALVAQSRGIAASAGMDRNQAAALTFAAASAGALDQVGTFAKLHGQGIVSDPEQLMRATQTIQTSLGAGQTGDLRAITSRLLAAGEHSPQKIAQLGPAAALAGVNAGDAGVNVNELLAAVAVQSKATGDSSIAGTMQKSLQKTLAALRGGSTKNEAGIATDEEGHILDQKAQKLRDDARPYLAKAGPGLMGELHAIQSMRLDPQQLQKLFGRQEGLMAYNLLLRNEGEFNQAVGEVGAAPGRDLTGRVLGLTGNDPRLAAAGQVRLQTAAAEEAAGGLGAKENAITAIFAHEQRQMLAAGETTKAAIRTTALGIMSAIPGSRAAEARRQIRNKVADDDSRLLVSSVQALGGEDAVYGAKGGWDTDSEGRASFERAAEKLERAAAALQESVRGKATLGGPNHNPGVPISP